jgi:hypothetical protein
MATLEAEEPGPHGLGVIARRAGVLPPQANKLLARAQDRDLVLRVGYGKYQLTGHGRELTNTSSEIVNIRVPAHLHSALVDLHRAAMGYVAALHIPHRLSELDFVCTLVDVACPPDQMASAIARQGRQQLSETAAGRAMLACQKGCGHSAAPLLSRPEGTLVSEHRRISVLRRDDWDALAICLHHDTRLLGTLTVTSPISRIQARAQNVAQLLSRTAEAVEARGVTSLSPLRGTRLE